MRPLFKVRQNLHIVTLVGFIHPFRKILYVQLAQNYPEARENVNPNCMMIADRDNVSICVITAEHS